MKVERRATVPLLIMAMLIYLISTGRTEEAIVEIRRSEELDPLSLVINTDYGEFYYLARR